MSRLQPVLEPDTCHHITVCCNNRDFKLISNLISNLIRQACRDLMLNAIHHAKTCAQYPALYPRQPENRWDA